MPTIQLPTIFSELLRSLNARDVRYLVIGGYAVAYHGHPRTTGDIGIWVEQSETNALRVVEALDAFGFSVPALKPDLFLQDNQIIRMGRPPLRAEVLTSASGVEFAACYERRVRGEMGDVEASLISLDDLKENKRASGRHKDLDDLERLP